MALRIGAFEEIQQEAPFSRFAQRNMEALLRAWRNGGVRGFAQAWDATFHSGWEDGRERQYPIRIIGDKGDCKERALEVLGAPDRQSRTAAEFWYLFYSLGDGWKWERHEQRAMTTAVRSSAFIIFGYSLALRGACISGSLGEAELENRGWRGQRLQDGTNAPGSEFVVAEFFG